MRHLPRHQLLAAVLACWPGISQAQTDYRNLDDGRPVHVEDARGIETYAWEVLLPYALEREKGGGYIHAVVPELAYGLFRNFHLGVKAPLALLDEPGEPSFGLAGISAFAFYGLTTEYGILPSLALRVDGALPLGSHGGSEAQVALKGLATRSWGSTRLHLNGAWRVGADGTPGLVEPLPRWWAGAALDRTFWRSSLLLIIEAHVARSAHGAPLSATAAAGIRWQWTPGTVLDLGLARGFRAGIGPEIAISVGLSHVFGVRALMPGAR